MPFVEDYLLLDYISKSKDDYFLVTSSLSLRLLHDYLLGFAISGLDDIYLA